MSKIADTKIKSAKYLKSLPDFEDFKNQKNIPEICFIGRSNVGKSSLLNYICNNKNLAKVSKTPGKTRYFNYFQIFLQEVLQENHLNKEKELFFVDMPGYGYAKKSKQNRDIWAEKMMQYFTNSKNLKLVCLLIDSSIPAQQIDLEMLLYLNNIKRNFCLIFTKADKKKKKKKEEETSKERFQKACQELNISPAFFTISSLNKIGKEELLAFILQTV
jgi:GTP-binding protein